MTVEDLVYSLENDVDWCYVWKGDNLIHEADIHTDNKELKEYFKYKVKSFNLYPINDDEIYDLTITLEDRCLC